MSRAPLPTVQEVEHLLQQMLMNNTEIIQQATQHLIKYLKKPASVPVLFQLLEQSSYTGVRTKPFFPPSFLRRTFVSERP